MITVEREKKDWGRGRQKNEKSTNAENNCLKKKQRPLSAFPNVVPNSFYTETT